MTDMLEILFSYGANVLLHRTHSLIALLDHDGFTLESNKGLDFLVEQFPEAEHIVQMLVTSSHADFQQAISDSIKNQTTVQTTLNFGVTQRNVTLSYNCWFIPAPENRVLIFGDLIPLLDSKRSQENINLKNELASVSLELQNTQKQLAKTRKELVKTLTEIEKTAQTDKLTQLPNRINILAYFEQQIKIARRYKSDLCLFILNYDHFKRINGNFGYKAGDILLQQGAVQMKKAMRASDFLGRYAGDEFIGILPNTGRRSAEILANRIRSQIEQSTFKIDDRANVKATVSIGIAQFRTEIDGADSLFWGKDSLLWRADSALLQAKENGGDCVHMWQESQA